MPNKKWTILVALAAAWLGYAPATKAEELSAQESKLVKITLGCSVKDDKCVVRQCYGSRLKETDSNDFIAVAKALFFKRITLVIDGRVYSACIVSADRLLAAGRTAKARGERRVEDVVCVTSRASFGFHQAYRLINDDKGFVPGNVEFFPLFFLTPEIQAWVDKGPLPRTRKMEETKVMSNDEVSAIFPKCDQQIAQNPGL